MTGPVPELADRATACAERLHEAERVLASHIDADGLTSAAIATQALERAEIPFEVVFEKQLDEDAVADIAATEYETVLFTDFGSGQLDVVGEYEDDGAFTPVIADHHQPADRDTEYHLNPCCSGSTGLGACWRELRPRASAGDGRRGESDRDRVDDPNRAATTDGGTVADAETTARFEPTTVISPRSPSSAPSATCRPRAVNSTARTRRSSRRASTPAFSRPGRTSRCTANRPARPEVTRVRHGRPHSGHLERRGRRAPVSTVSTSS